MESIRDVADSLEQALSNIQDARDDTRHIQGIDAIVAYEELDRLALLTKLALERVQNLTYVKRAA